MKHVPIDRLTNPDSSGAPCPICKSNSPPETVVAREMALGTREEFVYGICPDCGVSWLMNPPSDIGKYYQNYYSLEERSPQLFKRALRMLRNGFYRQFIGGSMRVLCGQFCNYGFHAICKNDLSAYECSYDMGFALNVCSMFGSGLKADSKILDYGCGKGEFVFEMSRLGFHEIIGMDPFLKDEIVFPTGARVIPGSRFLLSDSSNTYDVITMHHVLEHIENPFEVVRTIAGSLNKGGTLLVRIPNIGSPHFHRYRGNWWGFHAPRHFFLYSKKSLEIVLGTVGLEIVFTKCDSEYDHYLYSQEYELDIADNSPFSFRNGADGIFTRSEMRYWKEKSKRLNHALVGDSIAYYIKHK